MTTATTGAITGYTPVVTGRVAAIVFATTSTLATTADFTITSDLSKQDIWVEDNILVAQMRYPVARANTASGVALVSSETPIYVAAERIKIAIAGGGPTNVGNFHIVIA